MRILPNAGNQNLAVLIVLSSLPHLAFYRVYGIGYLLKLGSLTELRASDFFILSYGGLRGAIALALSLMLDRGHYKFANHFFACTMMMVLLTCFI
uniref:MFS_1_like domain-containing protein n=1 Tax=Macrostomum lignano TaxID=282301 RepID=A0A1I8F1C0_9PLAT